MSSDPVSAQLHAVLAALRGEIKPELSTGQAKFRAELMDMMLTRITTLAEGGDAGELFWDQVSAELGIERDARALGDVLAGDGLDERRVVRVVKQIAAAERERRVALEDRIAVNSRGQTVHRSVTETSVSPEDVTAYLRKRFPEDAGITATRVSTVPGGRSKVTILLELETASGRRDIVVRKDFELGSAGVSVAEEYPVILAAWEAGIPVPEPLWLEERRSAIGAKFIAFARVPGKAMGGLFQSDASPGFALQFAAVLAKLHNVDLAAGGLDARLRWAKAAHPVAELIGHFYGRYRELPPHPLIDAAFAWLHLQLPKIGNARALIHGDAGLHNLMGDGEKLTGLLDWEFAHAGDPAEDLAYCKYLIEKILPWEEFMAAYIAAGGKPISEARMRFFTLWRTLHLAVHTTLARRDFDSGEDLDLRKASIGYNTLPKQMRDLAYDLARFTEAA